jgi:abhydrolase domain-containing protein 17
MRRRPVPVWLQWLVVLGGAAVGGYLALTLYGCGYAERLIFQPPPPTYSDSGDVLRIPVPGATAVAARWLPCPGARATVLYCHGNAEDLGGVGPRLAALRDRLHVAVLGWDYPGYGRSAGPVGADSTLAAARAVRAYATETLGVPAEQLVYYGRSLGGAPAVELAVSGPGRGLVLESAFTSAYRVMTHVRLVPGDPFVNLEKLPRVRCPVLVMQGTADEVIPFRHGQQLFAAAPEPKHHLWVQGAGHNDVLETAGEAYWQALREFLQQ